MSGPGAPGALPAEAPPVAPGEPLAPGYEAIGLLRRGRTLEAYDAWSHERGCRCVVKTLRADRRADRSARRSLVAEGRLLLGLSHPHLVRGYELLERPHPAVVMETLTGETVGHLIERRSVRLSYRDLAHMALHVGSALGYMHSRGLVHLDLKPSNVIAEAGRAKLIDLSLARPPGRVAVGTGTWCYLAPEQARGDRVGATADVWGLGALLFEAATGEPPFDDPDAGWTSAASDESSATYEGDFPQLTERAPAVGTLRRLPPELSAVIDGCLEPGPADRPQLAALMAALEPLTGVEPSEWRWGRGPRGGGTSPDL